MIFAEYIVMFVFVAIMGFGLPGPGQASLIAAGALAGEGHLNVGIVAVIGLVALVVGSYVGYRIGAWKGRGLLDRPGPPLERTRKKLLSKGDEGFGHGSVTFFASAMMPSFLPGIFHVRLYTFMLVSAAASTCWTVMYVGLSYFFGAEIAHHIASTGTNAILGVVVLVVVGLGVRFGWSWWRAKRREQAGRPPGVGRVRRDNHIVQAEQGVFRFPVPLLGGFLLDVIHGSRGDPASLQRQVQGSVVDDGRTRISVGFMRRSSPSPMRWRVSLGSGAGITR